MAEGEAAEAKRRRMVPPEGQELEVRMSCLRHKIEAAAAYKRSVAELDAVGASFGEAVLGTIEVHRRALVREWLRLASWKVDLNLSGMSDSERSAEELPWLMLQEQEGTEMRWPTWAEAQALEKRMSSLQKQMTAISACMYFAEDQGAGAEAEGKEFLRLAKARRQAMMRECKRLLSLKRGPDLSGMSESEQAAEAEKQRQEKLQEARRLLDEGDIRGSLELQAKARILDFDAKQGGIYVNSFSAADLTIFDHAEESSVGPMRFTDRVYYEDEMVMEYEGINILSVKIACSDIGFPIQVYGTVVARDCIDFKRVYLFHRDSDHCQLVNSKDEALILTGPKRALALEYCDDYVETDLWVKDHQGHCRQFSKGIVRIPGTAIQILGLCEAETVSLDTRLSTVDVTYDVVECAMEATIAVEVVQGEFYGLVLAHTSSSNREILLYDSKVAGGNCHGVIQLMRRAVSVCVDDKLIVLVKSAAGDHTDVTFTPNWSGRHEIVVTLGDAMIRVQAAWSMIGPRLARY